jgi:AAHS family 4-hydroxybenzoate transporter-like MFS transporter
LSKTVNVSAMLDDGRWTVYQKLLIAGTALTIILDGMDNQLLPNAVPRLMQEWHHDRNAFTSALSTGPFGMMIGGAIGGYLGDRIGRRTALLGSVIAFAIFTLAVAFAGNLTTLTLLRFLAGIGLGGAMPNAAALAGEYVPKRQRPVAVTLTVVCIPLGGVVAAYLARKVIEQYGWQSLFLAGGAVTILIGVLLFFVLPESPRYLASHGARWPELTRLLRRMGHDVSADVEYVDRDEGDGPARKATLGDLFAPAYVRDTLALCASFFFGLLVNYIAILLIPVVFTGSGYDRPTANQFLELLNYGGVAGAIVAATVVKRFGSRGPMLGMCALAVIVAVVLSQMMMAPPASYTLMALMIVAGALLNGVQTTMYALAVHVYPTEVRGTGMGTAVAFGRIGNVLAPWAGNAALNLGANTGYFLSWAMASAILLVALALVTRHTPRAQGLRAGVPVSA